MSPDRKTHESNMQQLSFLDDGHSLPTIEQKQEPAPEPDPVSPFSALSTARIWFRQYLLDEDRPHNTVESYVYDLVVLEHRISDKPLHRINETDIAMFLADASSKVTRKRRLTSVKAFFRYLTSHLEILKADPTENFAPHPLEHHRPPILTDDEQAALMAAAIADEPWSAPSIWLMMYLGLGRTELLALRRDHIDRTAVAGPDVLIAYDAPGKHAKQRTLTANEEFAHIYADFLNQRQPEDVLFPVGPQAVNGMVDRVAKAAGLTRKITPQLLRHTAAVLRARHGLSVNQMLAFLGLANDARNRETVRIYMDMAVELGMMPPENSDDPGPSTDG